MDNVTMVSPPPKPGAESGAHPDGKTQGRALAFAHPLGGAGEAPGAGAYEQLTPDRVLDALASVGLRGDGRLMALSSYENRVYQVQMEDGSAVVAKFYRPGRWSAAQIQEEHDFSHELHAAEVPVVAPLVLGGATAHRFGGFIFSVSPRRGGRMPELDDASVLEWTGRFLARLHTVGAASSFVHRPALNLQSFGEDSRNWLLENQRVPLDVQALWADWSRRALDAVARHPSLAGQSGIAAGGAGAARDRAAQGGGAGGGGSAAQIAGGGGSATEGGGAGTVGSVDVPHKGTPGGAHDTSIRQLRLHGDCHPGNLLWTPLDVPAAAGPGPHFVDMDDSRTGPAVQDLWMLVSGSRAQCQRQLGILVDGYEQFRAFDRRELALIEPLRTLRLIHYSAWLARRWSDPIFPINFPWFGSSDYWKGQAQLLEDQCEAMQEEPLVV